MLKRNGGELRAHTRHESNKEHKINVSKINQCDRVEDEEVHPDRRYAYLWVAETRTIHGQRADQIRGATARAIGSWGQSAEQQRNK